MSTHPIQPREDIPGWGVDADPDNDPTFPMRDQSEDDAPGMNWVRPQPQRREVEVLMSVEHQRMPAVFGTTAPPAGVSGLIRRQAFRFSESQLGHWMLLMLADRVNVVEGLLGDLSRGHIPNPFAESGFGAEWRYNRTGAVVRLAATAAAMGALGFGVYLLLRRRRAG